MSRKDFRGDPWDGWWQRSHPQKETTMETDWLEDMVCSRMGGIEIGRMRCIAAAIRTAYRASDDLLMAQHHVFNVLRAAGENRADCEKWAKEFAAELHTDEVRKSVGDK